MDFVGFRALKRTESDAKAHYEAEDDEAQEHFTFTGCKAFVPPNFEAMSLFAVEPVLEVEDRVRNPISFGVRDDKNTP